MNPFSQSFFDKFDNTIRYQCNCKIYNILRDKLSYDLSDNLVTNILHEIESHIMKLPNYNDIPY